LNEAIVPVLTASDEYMLNTDTVLTVGCSPCPVDVDDFIGLPYPILPGDAYCTSIQSVQVNSFTCAIAAEFPAAGGPMSMSITTSSGGNASGVQVGVAVAPPVLVPQVYDITGSETDLVIPCTSCPTGPDDVQLPIYFSSEGAGSAQCSSVFDLTPEDFRCNLAGDFSAGKVSVAIVTFSRGRSNSVSIGTSEIGRSSIFMKNTY